MIAELQKTWALLTGSERRKAGWMLLLVILMAGAEVASVLSIMPFLSVLARPEVIRESPVLLAMYQALAVNDTADFTMLLGAGSVALVIATSAFKVVTQHALNRFAHMQRHSISARLLERYLSQPYAFFLARNSSDLAKNILSETDQLIFNLIQPLVQMIANAVVVSAMVLLIVAYDPWTAAGILIAIGLLYACIYGLVRRRLARIGSERVIANRHRYQASTEALGGIKEVKITPSAATTYTREFNRSSRNYSRHMALSDTLSQTPLYIVEAAGYTGLILIALALLLRTADAAQVLPALGMYGFAAYRMLPAAQIIYRGFAKLRFSSPALDVLHDDLSLPMHSATQSINVIAPRKSIRLKGIRFAYASAPDKNVLDGIDLTIEANTTVGIIGRSGAGKSTLMDVMLGLLQPQEGRLLIDDTVIHHGNVACWQRALGYVPQHIYLADASVTDNIAFGIPKDQVNKDAVRRAARIAQVHDVIINELPAGYDTLLGDRGVRLSGGQRQRIGIARALYRDPPVLLFDEATSALDAETERALNDAIFQLSGRKTIVIIAHKPSSLRYCQATMTITA